MNAEHGVDVWLIGCPVCLKLCCCKARASDVPCENRYHCYKKCGSFKPIKPEPSEVPKSGVCVVKQTSSGHEKRAKKQKRGYSAFPDIDDSLFWSNFSFDGPDLEGPEDHNLEPSDFDTIMGIISPHVYSSEISGIIEEEIVPPNNTRTPFQSHNSEAQEQFITGASDLFLQGSEEMTPRSLFVATLISNSVD